MFNLKPTIMDNKNEVSVNEMYVLVLWPESQEYMDKEWFDVEAVLCNLYNAPGSEHRLADESAAYFIPIKYINNTIKFIYS
jgi:hypothetical protein